MTENEISREVVDACYRIHTTMGPGLLESVYRTLLVYELTERGLDALVEEPVPIYYRDVRIDHGFRADLIVEGKLIVEIKSVETILAVHKKQLLTYLRLSDRRLGLLVNFNVELIKDGISRVVNGLRE